MAMFLGGFLAGVVVTAIVMLICAILATIELERKKLERDK